MPTSKLQAHIDSAGRLAAIINELGFECEQRDVLAWCADANVALTNDAKLPLEAFEPP